MAKGGTIAIIAGLGVLVMGGGVVAAIAATSSPPPPPPPTPPAPQPPAYQPPPPRRHPMPAMQPPPTPPQTGGLDLNSLVVPGLAALAGYEYGKNSADNQNRYRGWAPPPPPPPPTPQGRITSGLLTGAPTTPTGAPLFPTQGKIFLGVANPPAANTVTTSAEAQQLYDSGWSDAGKNLYYPPPGPGTQPKYFYDAGWNRRKNNQQHQVLTVTDGGNATTFSPP